MSFHYRYRYSRRGYGVHYQDYLLDQKFTPKSLHTNKDSNALTIPDLYDYVSSLKSSVEAWYEISNPRQSSLPEHVVLWLEKINRSSINECLPLVMVVLQKEKSEAIRVTFLEALEKFLFSLLLIRRSYVIDFDTSQFIIWAGELSKGKISISGLTSKIESTRSKILGDNKVIKQVSESLKDGGFYRWRGLRYFLYEYEQHLKEISKIYRDKLSWDHLLEDDRDHKTIEHIYPQRPQKQCWKNDFQQYTPKERGVLRHSLGNLVPLSQPKNSSFQNKPFLEKLGNEDNTIGFRYGSYSEIELTNYSKWTANEILKRGVLLMHFMSKRWDIDFGKTKDLVKFLNLEFVLKKESLEIRRNNIEPTTKNTQPD